MNHILERIVQLIEQRNWTRYKLAKEAGIPLSSLNSLFSKNNQPTITTLQKICDGLGITLSDFFKNEIPKFSERNITKEDEELLKMYHALSGKEKKIIQMILGEFQK